jgi:hypothetical protein
MSAPIALRVLGRSAVKYLGLVRAHCGTHQALHPTRRRQLDTPTAIPLKHGVLEMSETVIPRHDMLTKPCLHGFEVVGSRGAYTQCGSQAPPVPFPRSALPIVIRDRRGLDIELFRHIVHGG